MGPFLTFLVLTVCVSSQPAVCHEERLSFEISREECMANAQLAIVAWQTMHPELILKHWRCAPPQHDI